MVTLFVKNYTQQTNNLMKPGCQEKLKEFRSRLRVILNDGLCMDDLLTLTNKAIGPLILIKFSVCFITEVLGTFLGALMIRAFTAENGFSRLQFLTGFFFFGIGEILAEILCILYFEV